MQRFRQKNHPKTHPRTMDCGNVLFVVLIAVALFAALTYAITSSSRFSENNTSQEDNRIIATQLIQYAANVESGLQHMKISKSCTYDKFDFDKPSSATFNTGNVSCKVFHPSGGGIPFSFPDPKMKANTTTGFCATPNYNFTGVNEFKDVGENGRDDWAMTLPCITKELCLQINDYFEVTNPAGDAPEFAQAFWYLNPTFYNYKPQDVGLPQIVTLGDETAGKSDFCFKTSMAPYTGMYHYFHILYAR